jgi:hypothetical protein
MPKSFFVLFFSKDEDIGNKYSIKYLLQQELSEEQQRLTILST